MKSVSITKEQIENAISEFEATNQEKPTIKDLAIIFKAKNNSLIRHYVKSYNLENKVKIKKITKGAMIPYQLLLDFINEFTEDNYKKPTYIDIQNNFDVSYNNVYTSVRNHKLKSLILPIYNLTRQESIDQYESRPQRKTYRITKDMILLEMAKVKKEIEEEEKRKIK